MHLGGAHAGIGLLLAALFLLVACGRASSSATSPTATPTPAPHAACLPPTAIPAAIPIRASTGGCITGALKLGDGVAFGTQRGDVGVVRAGHVTQAHAAKSTGAVSDIQPLASGDLVTFVIDQGVGVFDTRTGQQVSLAGRDLSHSSGGAAAARRRISGGYYFALYPEQVRPAAESNGQLGARNSGGKNELIIMDQHLTPGVSDLCATYVPQPGALEKDAVCVGISDLVPFAPNVPPPPPPPSGQDGCLQPAAVAADPAHRLTLHAGASAFSPAALTVAAGATYSLTLQSADPGVVHQFSVFDAQHNIVRDLHGVRMCVTLPVDGSAVTVPLALAGPARLLTFEDPAHPALNGTLTVTPP